MRSVFGSVFGPVFGSVLLACLFVSGCGASDRAPPSEVVRSPLQERVAATRGTPLAVTPAPDAIVVPPAAAAPGSSVHPERATAQALDYFARALGVPVGGLRLDGVTALEAGGWRVTLRDPLDGRHTADVTADGITWRPQTRDAGTIALWREASGLLVIEGARGALTLRVGRDSDLAVPPAGTRVAFGYDPSPRGDGTPVLAAIERLQ